MTSKKPDKIVSLRSVSLELVEWIVVLENLDRAAKFFERSTGRKAAGLRDLWEKINKQTSG